MSLSSPLLINNKNLVTMKQLDNSSLLQGTNLSDSDFESYICLNLAKQTAPVDLSNNSNPLPNSLLIIDSSLNTTTIISNNDTVLTNENFAIKMNYISSTPGSFDHYNYSIGGGDKIPVNVTLENTSVTLFDSNIKIDISLNQDTQFTENQEWGVNYDRAYNQMNYFSCINSNLQAANGISPFYVAESASNIYSLGSSPDNSSLKYFVRNTSSIADNSGTLVPVNIPTNTLGENFCGSYVDNRYTETTGGLDPYEYSFDEFNSFKIIQAAPHVDATLKDVDTNLDVTGDVLPIKYNGTDINTGTFDFSGVFLPSPLPNGNHQNIGDGFTMSIIIGAVQDGGYSLENNVNAFVLDDSDLTSDVNNPYLKIDQQGSNHILYVENGTVTPSSDYSTGNQNFIEMGVEGETLESPYNATSGLVNIYVNPINDRVYYPTTGGSNTYLNAYPGTKNALLTDHIDVVYNETERAEYSKSLDMCANLLEIESVRYYVNVLAQSTDIESAFTNEADRRNLATNNSAVLTIAGDLNSVGSNVDLNDFGLTSYLPVNANTIQILSINNKSILANETQLLNPSDAVVENTTSTVTMQNIDLSELPYSDYKIKLSTKTVEDLPTLTGGWSFETTDPDNHLVGTPLKTSVLYDDYLFMTNGTGVDISMNYEFKIANPIINSTQAIKHQIKIAFKDLDLDLLDNDYYSNDTTVFYLDDQDIALTNTAEPVDDITTVSTSTVQPSSLNTGTYTYNKLNYVFKRVVRTRSFTAAFDPKFPFYTNLLLKTPVITEESIYYKIFDAQNNEQPSYLLKYFKINDELLSNVHVSIVNNPHPITEFLLTTHMCSIFNAELLGMNSDDVYEHVPDTPIVDLDPFFKLTNTITGAGTSTITVKFNNGAYVNEPYYTIETQNAPGTNISLSAKKYQYLVSSGGSELDNFSPYNNFFNSSLNMTPVELNIINDDEGNQTMTIYDTNGTTVLAVITNPHNFAHNYNIIVCLWPFMQVDKYYGTTPMLSTRTLAINNQVEVDYGVYYHNISPVSIGMSETFKLMTESFRLKHVNDVNYPNNIVEGINGTVLTAGHLSNALTCLSQNGSNYARSVRFTRLRGWNRHESDGIDVITLNRTTSNYVFKINISGGSVNENNQLASQRFTNIYAGKLLTVNEVVVQNTQITYNLGLKITANQSILPTTAPTSYNIYASVADYLVNIDSNPFNPNIIQVLRNGYITDDSQVDLFYPYITGVKAACIKSYGTYSLRVQRNIPSLQVYSLTTPSFIGNPVEKLEWTSLGTVPFNIFAWRGYVASNLNVYRINEHVMFYNDYTAYYVVAPPSINVYGYKSNTDVQSVPISGLTSSLFRSFDINHDENHSYVISPLSNATTAPLTLSQPIPSPFYSYVTATRTYQFQIQGNYIRIAMYNGGVGDFGTQQAPNIIDANATPLEYIYPRTNSWGLINNISNVTNVFTVSQDESLDYNISYNQKLPNTAFHNATQNIFFSIGNAFNDLPPVSVVNGYPSMYLRLTSSQGTSVAFYQANIVYNDVNGESGYYMIIDKYTTDSSVNYNSLLSAGTVRELFFPVASHYTKSVALSNTIVDALGNIKDQGDFIDEIDLADIDNASWEIDEDFDLQYIGLTISALSTTGINAMGDLLKYNKNAFLQSKALYVRRQDVIRVLNAIGSTVYRVTNGGNVMSQRIITSSVALYYPPTIAPDSIDTTIGGTSDIITLFAQNSLMDNSPF